MTSNDTNFLYDEDTVARLIKDTERLTAQIDALSLFDKYLPRLHLLLAIHLEGQATVAMFEDYEDLVAAYGKLDPAKNTVGWIRLSALTDTSSYLEAAKVLRSRRWQKMIRTDLRMESNPSWKRVA